MVVLLSLALGAVACTKSNEGEELPFALDDETPSTTADPVPASSAPSNTLAELEDLVAAVDGALEVETFCDLSWTLPTRKRLLNSDGDPGTLVEAFFTGTLADLVAASGDAPPDISAELDSAILLLQDYVAAAEAAQWDLRTFNDIPADPDLTTLVEEVERRAAAC